MRRIFAVILSFTMLFSCVYAKDIEDIVSESYILMDGKTGNVLVEKNADQPLPPASITKIMVMLLAMEAIDDGRISVDDIVTVSETAAVHEGSHVFLDVGEEISVHDLLKAIAVASGNDAAIAMGEYLCGTLDKFVVQMNKRAKELNMKNTNFINANGLDAENHVSSARDIAIMTHELLKHPKIHEYTTIWMDTLRNGAFQLSNTNKLIRFYEGATGMKTGSTSKAGFCISATATRNNIDLIAVTMNAKTSKERFADASSLLNYGFSNYSMVKLSDKNQIYASIAVKNGTEKEIPIVTTKLNTYLVDNSLKSSVEQKIVLPEYVEAPVEENQKIGEIIYYIKDKEVAKIPLEAQFSIPKISYSYLIKNLFTSFIKSV